MKFLTQGPGESLGAAALPIPAKIAQAFQSRGPVQGSPGTTAIPAPRPGAVPQGVAFTGNPKHTSRDAPEVWFPGVYYTRRDAMSVAPVSILSDNQMPLPAIDPRGLPSVAQTPPVFLGQKQIMATPQVPVFLSR